MPVRRKWTEDGGRMAQEHELEHERAGPRSRIEVELKDGLVTVTVTDPVGGLLRSFTKCSMR